MLLAHAPNGIVHIDHDDEEGTDEGDENYRELRGRPEQDRKRDPGQRWNRSQQLDHGIEDLVKQSPGAEQQTQWDAKQLRQREAVTNALEAHQPRLPVARIREI